MKNIKNIIYNKYYITIIMKLKTKNIKNEGSAYILKLLQTFNIKETLNAKYITNIMEFYNNDELIEKLEFEINEIWYESFPEDRPKTRKPRTTKNK
jgi:hypothetical protein